MEEDEWTGGKDSRGEAGFRGTAVNDLLEACQTAEQLRCLLEKEAEALRRFESEELLEIIHRKESLVGELAGKMHVLQESRGVEVEDTGQGTRYDSLKACLARIDRLNRSNRVFIEGALAHYKDFVDCLCPAGYGPRSSVDQKKDLANFKGLTFTKEI